VPLVSAGNGGSLGVTVAGKNLLTYPYLSKSGNRNGLDIVDNGDGSITIKGTATQTNWFNLNYRNIGKAWYNSTWTDGKIVMSGVPSSIRLDYDPTNYLIYITIPEGATIDTTVYPQVERGGVATEWEPPRESQTLTLSTPTGLPGIPVTSGGNYTDETGQQWVCDEVDFARGVYVQRVCSYTTTGKETILALTDTRWQVHLPKINLPIANGDGYYYVRNMCSHLASRKVYQIGLYENSFGVSMENMYFRLNAETTMAEITEFLGQGIDVKYTVDPIETPLSADELAAYAALHTNYPNTTILNDGGAGMEVNYVADTKLYIDNKINAMAAAIVNA
jgi:hypothetical protein